MASAYTYTLSLNDKMTSKMRNITGVSADAVSKINSLKQKTKKLQTATKDFGGSIDVLRRKIDLLQNERNLIDPKNMGAIKKYNREIKSLSGEINKLENVGRRGGLKSLFGQVNNMAGGMLTNPLALGMAGAFALGKSGMGFAENMAKVNITAQLDEKSLKGAYDRVFEITKQNKGNIDIAPKALEKIISQTGDLTLSYDILDSAMKGAKGGFVDIDTVSGALAQSLSIIGKENASAQEVLDTFFAAKRVGAGEFGDFARYMPKLIAGASNLGIAYKEVGGVFAYMTGKGQSAERASVLMENAFGVLGRGEVQKGMAKFGVNVFDAQGQMRSMLDIAKDINKATAGKSDAEKSSILERMGLKDKEAKNAFAILTSDTDKLASSLRDVANSAGETQRAIELSVNPMQKATELWQMFKTQMTEIGVKLLPIINGALTVLTSILGGVIGFFGWWSDGLSDANIVVYAMIGAVGGLTTVYLINKGAVIAHGIATAVMTAKTWLCNKAQKALKATMATTQWGLIALGIGAVAGGLLAMNMPVNKLDKAMNKLKSTFADFNVELSASKTESNDAFESAMKAKVGSEERAKAIKKINDQYEVYLPSLLTEKTNNDDLAVALKSVNTQLENKFRNQYYEKEMQAIADKQEPFEKKIYEEFQNQVGNITLEAGDDIRKTINDIKAGVKTPTEAGNSLSSKYGFNRDIEYSYANSEGKLTSYKRNDNDNLLFNLQNYGDVLSGQEGIIKRIKAQYGDVTGGVVVKKKKKKGGGGTVTPDKDTFNLDSVKSLKGSTAYGAIMSKLSPLKMATTTAVASAMLAVPTSDATTMPSVGDDASYESESKNITMQKFCDSIVIKIDKADGKGYSQIAEEVQQQLRKMVDDYDA